MLRAYTAPLLEYEEDGSSSSMRLGTSAALESRASERQRRSRPWRESSQASKTTTTSTTTATTSTTKRSVQKSQQRSLSKSDMALLTSRTRFSVNEIRSWHRFFVEGLGSDITISDMAAMFGSMAEEEEAAASLAESIFKAIEEDKEFEAGKKVDFKRFMLAIEKATSGGVADKLVSAFELFDSDGDGKINMEEMKLALSFVHDMEQKAEADDKTTLEARRLFRLLDEDGDGLLNVDEFVQGCLGDEQLLHLLLPKQAQS